MLSLPPARPFLLFFAALPFDLVSPPELRDLARPRLLLLRRRVLRLLRRFDFPPCFDLPLEVALKMLTRLGPILPPLEPILPPDSSEVGLGVLTPESEVGLAVATATSV